MVEREGGEGEQGWLREGRRGEESRDGRERSREMGAGMVKSGEGRGEQGW